MRRQDRRRGADHLRRRDPRPRGRPPRATTPGSPSGSPIRRARAVAVTRDGVVVEPGDETRLARGARSPGGGGPVFLGVEDGSRALRDRGRRPPRTACASCTCAHAAAHPAPGGGRPGRARRRACSTGTAGTRTARAAARATEVADAGHVRRCPACGAEHHPRTDPVVIMLVTRGDEVLLGRQPSWPPDRYSALAGFVEPGESLEEAVAREVLEESGVDGPRRALHRVAAVAVPRLAHGRLHRRVRRRRGRRPATASSRTPAGSRAPSSRPRPRSAASR